MAQGHSLAWEGSVSLELLVEPILVFLPLFLSLPPQEGLGEAGGR